MRDGRKVLAAGLLCNDEMTQNVCAALVMLMKELVYEYKHPHSYYQTESTYSCTHHDVLQWTRWMVCKYEYIHPHLYNQTESTYSCTHHDVLQRTRRMVCKYWHYTLIHTN